ncbi:MAG: cytochrome d ubiquinol oxidase subunit II [Chlamydiales bacterium]
MITPLEHGFMVFWFVIIMASMMYYAMLDGFDLGVGMLHLCTKKDNHRRLFLNAIGPVWDGNEVWLVVFLGGMLAGFPLAYATLLSALYIPSTIIIFALIFRAVSIEFRSKRPMVWWRSMWDIFFSLGSFLIAFGVGCALGNMIEGLPINENREYQGGLILTFLRPYAILVGIMSVALFLMHGVIFLVMKTDGDLQTQVKKWVQPALIFFIIMYVTTTMATLIYQEHIGERFRHIPWFFFIALANMLVIANIPRLVTKGSYGWAFLNSCANIALLVALYACSMFPELIRSSLDPSFSLTITNSAASVKTFKVLTVIVCIGLPLVIAYISWLYHIFRGKVTLDSHSY